MTRYLKLSDIQSFATTLLHQEQLSAATALTVNINENSIDFNQEVNIPLLSLNAFRAALSQNTGLQTLKFRITSEHEMLPDMLVLSIFRAFSGIPNPVGHIEFFFSGTAFERSLLTPENEIYQELMQIIHTAPAFQHIETFSFTNNPDSVSDTRLLHANFVDDLFGAIPNKSNLKNVTFHYNHLFTESNIVHTPGISLFSECTDLDRFVFQTTSISNSLSVHIGEFIRQHQTLRTIVIDSKHATDDVGFMARALENKKLNDVTFRFTKNNPSSDETAIYQSIGDKIRQLVGLSRLTLDIEYDFEFSDEENQCFTEMVISILNNPTLRIVDIEIDQSLSNSADVIQSLTNNKKLIAVQSFLASNPDIANHSKEIAERNLADEVRGILASSIPNCTNLQYISLHQIALLLKASYILAPSNNSDAQQLIVKFFGLTLEQFF